MRWAMRELVASRRVILLPDRIEDPTTDNVRHYTNWDDIQELCTCI